MLYRVLLCVLLAVSLTAPAHGQQTEFTIGVEAIDYYPLYAGNTDEYRGYARELFDAFAKKQGYTFTYKMLPVKRLFQDFLVEQTLDFKFPDSQYWSAELRKGVEVTYSEPAVQYIDGVMVKPENKGRDISELEILGTIAGFTPFDYLDRIESGAITVDESNDYGALLLKATLGRVDGVYSSVAVANYHMNDIMKQPGVLVFDDTLPHTRAGYLLSTIKHPQIVNEFNEFLQEEAELVTALKEKFSAEAGVN